MEIISKIQWFFCAYFTLPLCVLFSSRACRTTANEETPRSWCQMVDDTASIRRHRTTNSYYYKLKYSETAERKEIKNYTVVNIHFPLCIPYWVTSINGVSSLGKAFLRVEYRPQNTNHVHTVHTELLCIFLRKKCSDQVDGNVRVHLTSSHALSASW